MGGPPRPPRPTPSCEGVTLEATDTGVTADTHHHPGDGRHRLAAGAGSVPGQRRRPRRASRSTSTPTAASAAASSRSRSWDSKLDPAETKNGQINACQTALAMVGGNSLFNPDVTEMNTCADCRGRRHRHRQRLGAGQRRQRAVLAALVHHPGHRPSRAPADGNAASPAPVSSPPSSASSSYYQTIEPNLVGLYLVPGDLPTTVQSATYQIAAQAEAGRRLDRCA